jgi:hypothetical protein
MAGFPILSFGVTWDQFRQSGEPMKKKLAVCRAVRQMSLDSEADPSPSSGRTSPLTEFLFSRRSGRSS